MSSVQWAEHSIPGWAHCTAAVPQAWDQGSARPSMLPSGCWSPDSPRSLLLRLSSAAFQCLQTHIRRKRPRHYKLRQLVITCFLHGPQLLSLGKEEEAKPLPPPVGSIACHGPSHRNSSFLYSSGPRAGLQGTP